MKTITHQRAAAPSLVFLAMLIGVMGASESVFAEDYSSTNAQLFVTNRSKADPIQGTGTDDNKLTSLRLEHYGTFAYGDNYFFIDNYHGTNVGGTGAGSFGGSTQDQQFVVWSPRLSVGKLLGKDLSFGPIQDLSLATRVEYASYGSFRALGVGLGLDWKVPTFDYVITRLYRRDTNYNDPHLFFHTTWGAAYSLGSRKLHFDGYAWTTATDTHGREYFAEPDLTVEVDQKGVVQAGLRVTYSKYTSYSRTTPQFLVKVNF